MLRFTIPNQGSFAPSELEKCFQRLTQGVALGYHLSGLQPFRISVYQRPSAVKLFASYAISRGKWNLCQSVFIRC